MHVTSVWQCGVYKIGFVDTICTSHHRTAPAAA